MDWMLAWIVFSHSSKITPASQAQRPPVAGQLQITETQYLAAAFRRHRAFDTAPSQ
jgi:hypothetical protein